MHSSTRVVFRALSMALTAAVSLPLATQAASTPLPLTLVKDVVLSNAPSRFNYQDMDAANHRLYITNPGAARVVVFDTSNDRVVGEVDHLAGVRGVLSVPSLGRVYATPRTANTIDVIDPKTLKVTSTIPGGKGLASLAYADAAKTLFVSLAKGDGDELIDPSNDRVLPQLKLGSKAGYSVYDPASQRVLITAEAHNTLAIVDPRARRVTATYALSGCEGAHAIALDPNASMAYIACEDNAKLVSFNLVTDRVTGIDSVGDQVDVLAIDPSVHRLYVSSESGTVSVFNTSGASAKKLGETFFAKAAHTVAVDPTTHLVYFPLEDVGGHQVLRIMRPVL